MKEPIPLPDPLLNHTPWENEINPIWPASLFILRRNLNKYLFPTKMNPSEFQQTFEILKDRVLKTPALDQPICLKAEELSALCKQFLFEHFLCRESFQNTSTHQGFIVDTSSRFMAMLNIEDHLQLQMVDYKGAWENTWNTLNKMETALGETLEYAFNSRFGYLTSNPALSGTGFTVHVFLHLPALIHTEQLLDTLTKLKEEEVTVSGMQGSLDELVGDLVILQNTYTLGVNEENILHALHSMAMKLMALEKTLRTHIQTENHLEIKDLVCRAFGLLMHSYQLQTKEALSSLSLLSLGLDLGWIAGVTHQTLYNAFFTCRRSHLLHALNEKNTEEHEIPRKRAEYLHKILHGIELKIAV
ncbi:MAG: protein arginine kinase [Rhabdochlamydiaceae bacterium]|nr:protein arginine kinase [Rhabdochlamydiaceae bacterium]